MEKCENEKDFWKILRKSKGGVSNEITNEEWMRYFKEEYDGKKRDEISICKHRIEGIKIKKEEIKFEAINNLKTKKAEGEGGVKSEAWIEGGTKVKELLAENSIKIAKGGEIPEGWKVGQVISIDKKGEKNKAENYRGITLMHTDYKIYAEVLEERLVKEVTEKKILQETQLQFKC